MEKANKKTYNFLSHMKIVLLMIIFVHVSYTYVHHNIIIAHFYPISNNFTMICVTASISFYLLLIAIIIPFEFGNVVYTAHYADDCIFPFVMLCTSLVDVCSAFTKEINGGRFDQRKRKCVSRIFRELGPYWVRRSCIIKEETFWKLYDLLVPYYLKRK